MTVFYVKRVGNILVPDGSESNEEFEKVPRDKSLRCEVKQPRNGAHHRLFWTMCARIGQGIGESAEWVERAFKVATKYFDIYTYAGAEHLVLRSISYAEMDQIAFREWFEKCVQVAYEEWGVPPESLADLLAPQEDQKR